MKLTILYDQANHWENEAQKIEKDLRNSRDPISRASAGGKIQQLRTSASQLRRTLANLCDDYPELLKD